MEQSRTRTIFVRRRAVLCAVVGGAMSALLAACGADQGNTNATGRATDGTGNGNTGATSPVAPTSGGAGTAAGNTPAATSGGPVTAAPNSMPVQTVVATGTPQVQGTQAAGGSPAPSLPPGTTAASTATVGMQGRVIDTAPIPKPPTPGGAPPTVVGAAMPPQGAGTMPAPPGNVLGAPVPSQASSMSGPAPMGMGMPGPSVTPAPRIAARVTITGDRTFDPAQVTVNRGEAVQWTNIGRVPQTVTDDPTRAMNKANAILPMDARPWDSAVLNAGDTFVLTFDTPGDYTYFSIPGEGQNMTGKITVRG